MCVVAALAEGNLGGFLLLLFLLILFLFLVLLVLYLFHRYVIVDVVIINIHCPQCPLRLYVRSPFYPTARRNSLFLSFNFYIYNFFSFSYKTLTRGRVGGILLRMYVCV